MTTKETKKAAVPVSAMTFAGDMVEEEWRARNRRDDLEAQRSGLIKRLEDLNKQIGESASEETKKRLVADLSSVKAQVDDATAEISKLGAVISRCEEPRLEKRIRVRKILDEAGIKTGEELQRLGCTGFVNALLRGQAVSIDDDDEVSAAISQARFVLDNLGGSGFGLTCYVPINRFCLVHRIAGGLQEDQQIAFPEALPIVTRDLTPEEHGHIALVEAARRADSRRRAKDLLGGRTKEEDLREAIGPVADWAERGDMGPVAECASADDEAQVRQQKIEEALRAAGIDTATVDAVLEAVNGAGDFADPPFTCPEHGESVWRCRLCVAQMVADGDLEPRFHVDGCEIDADEVVEYLNDDSIDELTVFVAVGTWKRKLVKE